MALAEAVPPGGRVPVRRARRDSPAPVPRGELPAGGGGATRGGTERRRRARAAVARPVLVSAGAARRAAGGRPDRHRDLAADGGSGPAPRHACMAARARAGARGEAGRGRARHRGARVLGAGRIGARLPAAALRPPLPAPARIRHEGQSPRGDGERRPGGDDARRRRRDRGRCDGRDRRRAAGNGSSGAAPGPAAPPGARRGRESRLRAALLARGRDAPAGRALRADRPLMRIAVITPESPPSDRIGGIGTHSATIAPALARRGHEVGVVTRGTPGIEERDGVRVERVDHRWLPNRPAEHLLSLRTIAAAVRRIRPDVVQAAEWEAEAWWLARFGRLPVVTRLATPTYVLEELNQTPRDSRADLIHRLERDQTRRSAAPDAPTHAILGRGGRGRGPAR